MKQQIKITLVAVMAVVMASTGCFAATVELPSNTIIRSRVSETLNGRTLTNGQLVTLLVNDDIKVKDKVVIKRDTPIEAEVGLAKGKNFAGAAGKIILMFKSVKAVNGQDILLVGNKEVQGQDKIIASVALGVVCCPLFFLMRGEDAIIPAGQQVNVYTMQTSTITL